MTASANLITAPFWGAPKFQPDMADVARLLGVIRELTDDQGDTRTLQIATSAAFAICGFIENRFGPREVLALLDGLRDQIKALQ
jgi:hypothetical protein